jgi:hypothetical protein
MRAYLAPRLTHCPWKKNYLNKMTKNIYKKDLLLTLTMARGLTIFLHVTRKLPSLGFGFFNDQSYRGF